MLIKKNYFKKIISKKIISKKIISKKNSKKYVVQKYVVQKYVGKSCVVHGENQVYLVHWIKCTLDFRNRYTFDLKCMNTPDFLRCIHLIWKN